MELGHLRAAHLGDEEGAIDAYQLAFDALPSLRDAFAVGTKPYGRVDRHFSPEGHATVANLIASAVVSYLAPDSNSTPSR